MIELQFGSVEVFDPLTYKVVTLPPRSFRFEHCLKSLYNWEAEWQQPFLPKKVFTIEEWDSYMMYMCLDTGFSEHYYSDDMRHKLLEYMNQNQSAATFQNDNKSPKRGIVQTAETLYGSMAQLGIPFSCDEWHLSRLVALLATRAYQESPPKKMSREDVLKQNAELNAKRKAKMKGG